MADTLAQRYDEVLASVRAVCAEVGRSAEEVRLIAVSKTVGPEAIREAIAAGARDLGENRPDRIVEMAGLFPEQRWHFIGNIQSRRIPDIVGAAALIHSLYQVRHAEKIDAAAAALGKVQDVLIEVNVSGEESKSGVTPKEAQLLVEQCAALPHVRVRGLMTMAPQGDGQRARECFEDLAALAASIRAALPSDKASAFCELSMGMSEDWPQAIAAGATMIRVGRAIFSDAFSA